jgi:hypothetical protein
MGLSIILGWIIFSLFAWKIASKKGNNGFLYFLLSIILSPLIGIIAALISSTNQKQIDANRLNAGTSKKCPFCAEIIKKQAITCRFCGKDLPAEVKPEKKPKKSLTFDPIERREHSLSENQSLNPISSGERFITIKQNKPFNNADSENQHYDPVYTGERFINVNQDNEQFEDEYDERDERDERTPVHAQLEFDYIDASGSKSHRTVDTFNMSIQGINKTFWGYCHYRQDYRTFNIKNISNCIDLETGEIITKLSDFLIKHHEIEHEEYKKSVKYTIDQLKHDDADLLGALFYISKADGRFSAAEKTVIAKTFIQLTGDSRITEAQIKAAYSFETAPTLQDYQQQVNRLSLKDSSYKQLVMQTARDIVNTQKQITEQEQEALDYMAAKFNLGA